MNKLKRTSLGLMVALCAFGFSAFTTIKKSGVVVYYKTNSFYPLANDPRGYAYYSSDRCEPTGNLCSAQWQLGTNPTPLTDGQALPTTGVTFQAGSVITGHFE